MHEYLFSVSTVRLAVVIGVIIGMLFYERTHLTTGGAVVPGFLAIFVLKPLYIVVTLLNAYLTYLVVSHFLSRRFILYGRDKFSIEILVALALSVVFIGIAALVEPIAPQWAALYGIGFVIPGVIAHDMFRQQPGKTLVSVLANVALVLVVIYLFRVVVQSFPSYAPSRPGPLLEATFSFPIDWLIPAVMLSAAAGLLMHNRLDLLSGGFVTGGYLAMVLPRPLDVLFVAVVGLITYVLVAHVMMRHMLIFGRRKFSMMIFVSAILAWGSKIVIESTTGGAYIPWSGFHVIALVLPALLANDAERQGLSRTLAGATLSTGAVFVVMGLAAWII